MPIVLRGEAFTDTTLRSGLTFDQRLADIPEVSAWFVPDVAYVTKDGDNRVSAIADRSAQGRVMAQATSGKQPLWLPTGGANGRPALSFDATRFDAMASPGSMPSGVSQNWTKAIAFSCTPEPVSGLFRELLCGTSASQNTHRMAARGTSSLVSRVGVSTLYAQAGVTQDSDEWSVFVATWDAATSTTNVSLRTGGAGGTWSAWASNSVVGAQMTDNMLAMGALSGGTSGIYNGLMASAIVLNVDLSASANATLLATVQSYFDTRYFTA